VKRTSLVVLVFALVGLVGLAGCLPKAVGVAGGPPVDRPTFERQAATRRAELVAERVTVKAGLAAARSKGDPVATKVAEAVLAEARAGGDPVTVKAAEAVLTVAKTSGDPVAIAAAETAAADHRAATAKFNCMYKDGIDELDRQAADNAATFAALETIGQVGPQWHRSPLAIRQAGVVKVRKMKAARIAAKSKTDTPSVG